MGLHFTIVHILNKDGYNKYKVWYEETFVKKCDEVKLSMNANSSLSLIEHNMNLHSLQPHHEEPNKVDWGKVVELIYYILGTKAVFVHHAILVILYHKLVRSLGITTSADGVDWFKYWCLFIKTK